MRCVRERWPVFVSKAFFFFNDTATTEIYTLSLHDALPIWCRGADPSQTGARDRDRRRGGRRGRRHRACLARSRRSEEHTSELQSQSNLVCRLLLEKKKKTTTLRRCTHALRCSRTRSSGGSS